MNSIIPATLVAGFLSCSLPALASLELSITAGELRLTSSYPEPLHALRIRALGPDGRLQRIIEQDWLPARAQMAWPASPAGPLLLLSDFCLANGEGLWAYTAADLAWQGGGPPPAELSKNALILQRQPVSLAQPSPGGCAHAPVRVEKPRAGEVPTLAADAREAVWVDFDRRRAGLLGASPESRPGRRLAVVLMLAGLALAVLGALRVLGTARK